MFCTGAWNNEIITLLLIVIIWYQGSTKTQTRDKKKQNNIQPSEEIRQRKTAFDQDWTDSYRFILQNKKHYCTDFLPIRIQCTCTQTCPTQHPILIQGLNEVYGLICALHSGAHQTASVCYHVPPAAVCSRWKENSVTFKKEKRQPS